MPGCIMVFICPFILFCFSFSSSFVFNFLLWCPPGVLIYYIHSFYIQNFCLSLLLFKSVWVSACQLFCRMAPSLGQSVQCRYNRWEVSMTPRHLLMPRNHVQCSEHWSPGQLCSMTGHILVLLEAAREAAREEARSCGNHLQFSLPVLICRLINRFIYSILSSQHGSVGFYIIWSYNHATLFI